MPQLGQVEGEVSVIHPESLGVEGIFMGINIGTAITAIAQLVRWLYVSNHSFSEQSCWTWIKDSCCSLFSKAFGGEQASNENQSCCSRLGNSWCSFFKEGSQNERQALLDESRIDSSFLVN